MTNQKELDAADSSARSPTKPPGILLTPGTATTRRKRVSFGRDVKAGSIGQQTTAGGRQDDGPGKSAGPFSGKDEADKQPRPKSRLTQVLENARKNKKPEATTGTGARDPTPEITQEDDDAEWYDDPERDPDVTVDLNEPHSQSGKYWKSCFETYHADAKAEMEKLVKYKQLAKSYAKMKDSEALDLAQKLREEQEKVKLVEQRVSEMSRDVTSRAKDNGGTYDANMVDELHKQKALALEYREQVRELEALLAKNDDQESGDSTNHRRQGASPRTQRTILETQRELRKARTQIREIGKLRDEISRLKSRLQTTEQRGSKLAEENKRLAADLSQRSSKILDLEKTLDNAIAENRQKDRELRRLEAEHEQLKGNAKTRFVEAERVLQKKNDQITGLRAEIRALKAEPESRRATDARRRRNSLDSTFSIEAKSTRAGRHGEAAGPDARHSSAETLASSRALRKKLEADLGKDSSSSVLSDRGNLQNARQTPSDSSNRHSYPSKGTVSASLEASLPPITTTTATRSVGVTGPALEGVKLRRKSQKNLDRQNVPVVRPLSPDSKAERVDLMRDHYMRLGGPVETNASTAWDMNASRTRLPPDRRVAAIARIERRKAERARALSNAGGDKENVLI